MSPLNEDRSQQPGIGGSRLVILGVLGGLVVVAAAVAVVLSLTGDSDGTTTEVVDTGATITLVGGGTAGGDDGEGDGDEGGDGDGGAGTDDGDETTTSPPIPSADQHWIMLSGHVAGQWTGADWMAGATVGQVAGETFIELDAGETLLSEPPALSEFCWFDDGVQVPWFETEFTDAPFKPLAVSGIDWPTRWGEATEITPAAAHVQSVENWLDSVGLGDEPAEIERALRFDIEGDGVDEVLLVAHHGETRLEGSTPGSYSALIFRRVGPDEQVVETILAAEFAAYDAPPAFSDPNLVGAWVPEYRDIELLDLNGDGLLELLTEDIIYESWGWTVTELGPTPTEVLSIRCGV